MNPLVQHNRSKGIPERVFHTRKAAYIRHFQETAKVEWEESRKPPTYAWEFKFSYHKPLITREKK